jgi:prepilin-type N-terminal cleavage/methylation domain-containing protein
MYWRDTKGFICKSGAGFTLLELLVVMALLSVVSTVTVLVVNPAELLRQARDAERLDNFASIERAIGLIQANDTSANLGAANTVYVSLPSDQADCSDLGLPDLPQVPVAWSYVCASSDNYRKTDGSGWLPINFENLSGTSLFATLPVDPINVVPEGYYYTYVHQNPFKLTAIMESDKYRIKMFDDGGPDYSVYEVGSASGQDLANFGRGLRGYWKLDDTGATALDSSSNGNDGLFTGGTAVGSCRVDGCIDFNLDGYVDVFGDPSLDVSDGVTLSVWVQPRAVSASRTLFTRLGSPSPWHLNLGGGFQVTGRINFSNSSLVVSNDVVVGEWNHLVITYDNSTVTLYLDNEVKMQKSYSVPVAASASPVHIAGLPGLPGTYYTGLIDDVRLYNRALSTREVETLYELVAP